MGLKDFERQKIRCDQNLGVSTRTWRFNWLYPRAIKHCWKIPNVSPQDIPEGKYIFTFYARILDKKTSTCLKPASRISGHGSGQSPPKKREAPRTWPVPIAASCLPRPEAMLARRHYRGPGRWGLMGSKSLDEWRESTDHHGYYPMVI